MSEPPKVQPVLACEHCTYSDGRLGALFYGWDKLLHHVQVKHWTKAGHAKNGQQLYLCQHCGSTVQMSYEPSVDFAGNLYCGDWCARQSLDARFLAGQMVHLLAQEERDEAYVRQSILRGGA